MAEFTSQGNPNTLPYLAKGILHIVCTRALWYVEYSQRTLIHLPVRSSFFTTSSVIVPRMYAPRAILNSRKTLQTNTQKANKISIIQVLVLVFDWTGFEVWGNAITHMLASRVIAEQRESVTKQIVRTEYLRSTACEREL